MREKIDAMNMTAWEEWRNMVRHMRRDFRTDRTVATTIVVCDEWRESFDNFLRDMGRPPLGKHLFRITAKNMFYKENCYWG